MIPSVLRNYGLFLNGVGYAGRVAECELPEIEIKTEEVRGAGHDGTPEVDMGMEAMEAKFVFNEYIPEVMKNFGNLHADTSRIILKGSKKRDGERSVPIYVELGGGFKKSTPGSWKAGDLSTHEHVMAVNYFKLLIGGERVYEIDVGNMVRFIGDTDQLADIRADIGR